ncbi:beta-ketoacyl-ACP reductase [Chloroflexota bacterium]
MILQGKVALITGSSRGIGRAVAMAFAQEGADIVVNYLKSEQLARETVNEVRSMGRTALAIQADVTDYNQVQELVKRALDKFSKIDILVNNAGVNSDATLTRMSAEMWNEVVNVNLTGVFNSTKAAIGHMKERKSGRVINISSIVGQIGVVGTSNYAAAKAGVMGFTKAVAKEVIRYGITVNALALGYFDIGVLKRLPPKIQESILQQIPMGRFGEVKEITHPALFLASDGSSYITGQIIHVNGGYYM